MISRLVRCTLLAKITTKPLPPTRSFIHSSMTKNSHQWNSARQQKKRKAQAKPKEGSDDEVLKADVARFRLLQPIALAKEDTVPETAQDSVTTYKSSLELDRFKEVEVKISYLSSTGNGLGLSSHSSHIYVVPFTLPGDSVRAKIVNRMLDDTCILTDFVEVIQRSPQRRDDLVGCRYFSICSGCQLQMLPYSEQLAHKKTIIERAYLNFSNLSPELVPKVGDTIGSPLQYGYRTKLTPHFDGPGGMRAKQTERRHEEVPPIGFMAKGKRRVLDIEDCPIGTDAVREGMKSERARVARELHTFKRGATLLLRESTERIPKSDANGGTPDSGPDQDASTPAGDTATDDTIARDSKAANTQPYTETKTCVTDSNALTTEYIGPYTFQNAAGAFFQNNNSILPTFTDYIRAHALPPQSTSPPSPSPQTPITNLIDAYCGSGLFTIALSPLFTSSLGIDIAAQSITAASNNASLNHLSNARFIAADAKQIFADVTFPAQQTVVVIDPPRKGCDEGFLRQLLRYGPERIVYVSCNVHTQARDVGVLVEGLGRVGEGREEVRYGLESLRGFDFFPQTGHVEGVAVLRRERERGVERAEGEDGGDVGGIGVVGANGGLSGSGAGEAVDEPEPVIEAASVDSSVDSGARGFDA